MPMIETVVDVDLDDFTDEDLIDEVESRGYVVLGDGDPDLFEAARVALLQGRKEEGFILLERAIPDLKGLLV